MQTQPPHRGGERAEPCLQEWRLMERLPAPPWAQPDGPTPAVLLSAPPLQPPHLHSTCGSAVIYGVPSLQLAWSSFPRLLGALDDSRPMAGVCELTAGPLTDPICLRGGVTLQQVRFRSAVNAPCQAGEMLEQLCGGGCGSLRVRRQHQEDQPVSHSTVTGSGPRSARAPNLEGRRALPRGRGEGDSANTQGLRSQKRRGRRHEALMNLRVNPRSIRSFSTLT